MTHRRQSRPLLIWLLLAAVLLLRAAVPAGWMPMAEQDGVRIALCAGSGAEFLTLGRDGKLHKDAPGPSAPRETCPFALAASAASLPPELHLSQPAVELAQQSTTELAEIALAQRRYPRPPTTGPPALA